MRGHDEFGRVPFRRPRPVRRRDASEKLELDANAGGSAVVPMRVRVEVRPGRHSTASAMRAHRVMQEIEGSGGLAKIVELETDGSALVAELDTRQAERLARLPFVRRIVTLN